MRRYSRITGTGSYLPPRRLTNADLVAELAQRLQRDCDVTVSLPTLCRMLQQLGWHRKKRQSTRPNEIPKR